MKILISELQIKKLTEHIYTDDLSTFKNVETKIELVGSYDPNDLEEYLKVSPYKTLRKIVINSPISDTIEYKWALVTEKYPLVIIKIPLNFGRPVNKKQGDYSIVDRFMFVIFAYYKRDKKWLSRKVWLDKQLQDMTVKYYRHIIDQTPDSFIDNLINLSFFDEVHSEKLHLQLSNIIYSQEPTVSDDSKLELMGVIDKLKSKMVLIKRNGLDPKPLLDLILQKYGQIPNEIEILSKKDIQQYKFPKDTLGDILNSIRNENINN